ncbi:uncharacterized protein At3g06530-like [Vicia villosa]|uniref:uncharacterized protein At3g06530-like n=1 Tax=Vicia villosa TaxID=3911 RepID=UPI00273B3307|nr:uncharacterized protein At3g06530-like [Vicia villosa]XP_058732540.1 uncharacterized protein At3g06530-like [Vicia villosa]XP_058732541.1 uncharacterized protein At3g06530-like [Vicia villosa]XP_058732542.1 uncharacterized protein At3g06530-like [Vicia villosa]XP_058732543.1 uncharacterized protein At3g06530-like [Vicia villosa]
MSAGWAKKILIIVNTKYPSELRGAVNHFILNNKSHSKKDDSLYKILCKMLDGNLDSPSDISESKVWFALYHPKADVRRTTLRDINSSGIMNNEAFVSEGLVDIQEAILRQLDDKDLTVVQAALNVDGLQNVLGASKLIETLASCCLEDLFPALVFLCHSANSDVQSATKEALMHIDIDFSTVGHILDLILAPKCGPVRSADEKTIKRQKLTTDQEAELPTNDICTIDDPVYLLSSLLDVLLLKKGITNRHILLDPLFKLLSKVFSEEWVNGTLSLEEGSSQPSSSPFESVNHIQQTLLIILEDIIMSPKGIAALNEKMTNKINITLLIECARTTNVLVISNHIFSLLSAVIKVLPEKVFEHILDILPVIGESAVTQITVIQSMFLRISYLQLFLVGCLR